MATQYFSQHYDEARHRFKERVTKTGGRLKSIPIGAGALTGPAHEPLSIDVGFWGPESGPTLLISSGLHGIEGYCGSGIQLAAMEKQYPAELKRIFIHALNPYGMAHLRRVNENNVDLNRNFIFQPQGFDGCSEGYHKLNRLLNPEKPFKGVELLSIIKTIFTIVKHGIPALKQAIASGQYAYPQGLFFGGAQLEEGPKKIMAALEEWLQPSKNILHVDFHTGLGEFGDYALLLEAPKTSPLYQEMNQAFGAKVQPWAAGEGVAYGISGGFPTAMQDRFGANIRVLTCEYGTYNPRKVIEAMTAENRAHFFGGKTEDAKKQFKEIFYPQNPQWREKVLAGGLRVIDQALDFLVNVKGAPHE